MFGVITAFINLISEIIGGVFRLVGGCLGSIALGLFLMVILAVVVLGHIL